ncbi:hypothetical protein [Anatilimnocola floriformis]|uniref:hypothetical protein n=1 Tax=Anatilimnocola floriformis TaxID=2948575 RepID=UPI0020C36D47|nr:hypothetical protein [Anatilimnocola floriformis]
MTAYVTTVLVAHVAVSLVALALGFVVTAGFLRGHSLDRWNAWFLGTTIVTSLSGYLFPVDRVLPSHILGVISLVVLAVAVDARFRHSLAGWWRPTYVASAMAAFYLNFFVLVVQAFLKVPTLHALAPTQAELPFALTQLLVLVAFATVGTLATLRFRPTQTVTA